MSDFGDVLRKLREERGLSVNQLALYSNVSPALISKVENKKRGIPKPETIEKLAKGLKMRYEELMYLAGHIDFIEMPERLQKAIDEGKITSDDLKAAPFYKDGKMGVVYELKEIAFLERIKKIAESRNMELDDPRFLELIDIAIEVAGRYQDK